MDVLVAACSFFHLGQHFSPLGVVGSATAGQHELKTGHETPGQAPGLDDPDRVFEPIIPGNLGNERPVRVQVELVVDGPHLIFRQFDVLVAERIDAGRDEILGVRQRLCKCCQREDAGVVGTHPVAQVLPHPPVGTAGIDVAAPDPLAPFGPAQLEKRRRLRIVDDHEIRFAKSRAKQSGSFVIGVFVRLEQAGRQVDRVALQTVVKRLGALVEIGFPGYHLPARLQPQLLHQGNHFLENLGHSPAHPGRIDVHHPTAPQRPRKLDQV